MLLAVLVGQSGRLGLLLAVPLGLLSRLGLLPGFKLVLPPVRYCHADDPTEAWPTDSAAGVSVAAGVAGSGTRCRYVHIPLI